MTGNRGAENGSGLLLLWLFLGFFGDGPKLEVGIRVGGTSINKATTVAG
jgi:hypothetical protein